MKSKFKRVVLSILSFILIFQAVLIEPVYADRDSNDFRSEFIAIKKGQSMSDIDVNNITMEELRFLAIYLSNFYIPWSTSFDYSDENSDEQEKAKEKMIQTLSDNCGIDKTIAEALVNAIFKASLQSAKPLYYTYPDDANYSHIGALSVQSSGGEKMSEYGYTWTDEAISKISVAQDGTTSLSDGTYRLSYGALLGFAWHKFLTTSEGKQKLPTIRYFWGEASDSGSYDINKVAFANTDSCTSALAHCLSSVNMSGGVGSNIFSVTVDEVNNLGESIDAAIMPFAQIYTDWVGNIFVDDGFRRVVLVPACVNPYTFSSIKGEPNESRKFNLISLSGIYGLASSPAGIIYNKKKTKVYIVLGSGGIRTQEVWKLYYGSGDDFNMGALEDKDNLGGKVVKALNLGEQDKLGFPNFMPITKGYTDKDAKNPNRLVFDTQIYTDYVFVDTVGEAEWEDGSKFKTESVVDHPLQVKTGMTFNNIKKKAQTMSIDNADNTTLTTIYMTYLYAYSNYQTGDTTFDADKHKIDMKYDGDRFPQDFDNEIDWSIITEEMEEQEKEEKSSEVLSMIYYILHPSKGMHYVSVWAKNKISAVLLGWHTDMVGASESNTSTGMTRYIGFTGYTTLPALNDLTWTSWLMENYNNLIVYLIVIIAVILCCYIVIGSLTFQRAILGLLMFGILVFIPPVAINACVGVVNQACDSIYGSKFTYWALVQHQSYMQELHSALQDYENGDYDSYTDFVMGRQVTVAKGADGSEPGADAVEQTDAKFASVKLKWMSPKKFNYLVQYSTGLNDVAEDSVDTEVEKPKTEDENNENESGENESKEDKSEENKSSDNTLVNNSHNIVNMGRGLLTKMVSGEEFLDEPDALYLYRDYLDITTYALKSYNLYNFYNGGASGAGNYVNTADGKFKLQVGTHWGGDRTNKNITYTSGVPLRETIYSNYEASSGTYTSDSQFKDTSSISAIRKGFLLNTMQVDGSGGDVSSRTDYYSSNTMSVNYLLNFTKPYNDIRSAKERMISDIENNNVEIGKNKLRGYGIPQQYFNFVEDDLTDNAGEEKYKDREDDIAYFYYGLYSESPYYFFNYNVQDQLYAKTNYSYSKTSDSSKLMKDLFLGNNLEYFYNYSKDSGDGFGELRDFMNMHDLFYYVIPLMKEGIDLVEIFDKAYGMPLYEDIKISFTMDGGVIVIKDGERFVLEEVYSPDGDSVKYEGTGDGLSTISYKDLVENWTEEEIYKFWHNYNVVTLFNAYCTWVDAMYDCKYANGETIHIGGKSKFVEDPLDPTCYYTSPIYDKDADGRIKEDASGEPIVTGYKFDGRPMVFSRSEMKYYGLEWNDLTRVEQKIIKVQDNVYEKSIDLMNYYTFDDNVISSAYSMIQLFEFNKEFSQNNIIGESYVMYPQSYELKAFTYDAYLRLIISNTTGDDLQADNAESLYERTMRNSSITFGILLIILDILCVYLIPAFKVFFLVILFLMSIVMIVASAVKIELNIIEVTWKSLIKPLLSFCAITIGLAFIVALFLSNGAKGVTGDTTPSIQLGDPTMVTAVMIFINASALYLYWKVGRAVTQDFVKYAKAVANNIGGSVMGALKTIGGVALASTAINALRDRDSSAARGTGVGGRGNANGKPEPIATGNGVGGSGGSGSGGPGYGDGIDPQTGKGLGHGQDPLAGKPDNEKDGGNSTSSYEDKVKAGKERRDSDTSGAGVATAAGVGAVAGASAMGNETDGVKKMTAREKSKVYKERANEQRGNIDSIESIGEDAFGNKVGTGGRLATARLKVSEKKNRAMSGLYSKQADIQDRVRTTGERAKKGAGNRLNASASYVRNSKVGKTVSGIRKKVYDTKREYSTVVRSANSTTQRDINNINRQRKDSIKKSARVVGTGAKNVAVGTSRLVKGAGSTVGAVGRRTVVKGAR